MLPKLQPARGKPLPSCALLQVRLQEPDSPPLIDMRVALATMDKLRLGLADRRLDASEAKTRLATLLAGRAVALALTPGIPPIEHISMQPRGGVIGRLLFENLVRQGHASLAQPRWQAKHRGRVHPVSGQGGEVPQGCAHTCLGLCAARDGCSAAAGFTLAARQHAHVHPSTSPTHAAACCADIRAVAVLQEWGKRSSAWASLIQPGRHSAVTLDRPLTAFEVCCGLLVPLYVGRALEEAYFGKDARTLMTSDEVGSLGSVSQHGCCPAQHW